MNVREWALPVYTILMQLATGALFVLWVIRARSIKQVGLAKMDHILTRPVLVVLFTILVAIVGSHFHLSQPLFSFLAVLNLRHSWLSREILFTILMLVTCVFLVDAILNRPGHPRLKAALGWAAVLFGSGSIYCMSNIYLLPTQAPWNHWITILMFFGSGLLLGTTSAAALLIMDTIFTQEHEPELAAERLSILQRGLGWMAALAGAGLVLVVALNGIQVIMSANGDELAHISLSLLLELYRPLLALRFVILFAGVVTFILVAARLQRKGKVLSELVMPVYMACLLVLVAEILGRFLFYASHVRLGI